MTNEELHNFMMAQMAQHVAGLSHEYSEGQLTVETPDRPVTQFEFRSGLIALQITIVEAFEALGLVESG